MKLKQEKYYYCSTLQAETIVKKGTVVMNICLYWCPNLKRRHLEVLVFPNSVQEELLTNQ